VPFEFAPGPLLLVLFLEALYIRAVHVLRARGYEVPVLQQAAWHAGVLLTAIGLLGPIDAWADELLVAHMGQHLLIADLAAPFLLIGIRSPVYVFLLPKRILVPLAHRRRLRHAFRVLRRPLVAVPVWALILYGWHFAFMFEAALKNEWVHLLQHWSFVGGAVLVWWSVIEPKKRHLPGELWKVPYIIGARVTGMFLGMAFIIMRSPAYPDFYGKTAPEHGWSALTDQQVAGAMMLGLDLIVMLFGLAFFFYRSSQEHDQAERAAAVAS
jgi:cytochrome c oxidase assembly factor CtaG